ncbi:MAG: NADPH:quinone reductase [Nocardioidaceae bacterium]|nr:MAG: NADPH:quinone reductase [Nocardioidaceae bacterium]
MQAAIYTQTGTTDVLRIVERDPAEPGPGEVRVKVIRSAVNPTDWKSRSSSTLAFPEVVPNQDGSGIIDAVGDGVLDVKVGDRVWVILAAHQRPTGTAQEFTVLPADRVALLPDNASFDLGADLGVPAITAHRALTTSEDGPSRLAPEALAGRTVLVAGGAGAVGNAAIQLARWAGATVVATVSSEEKARLAAAAGAHEVINHRQGDLVERLRETAPGGFDIVVEVAPAVNLQADLEIIKPRGTIAIYANEGGDTVTLPVRSTFTTNARLQWILLYTVGQEALVNAVVDINRAVADGAFKVGQEHGLPLHHYALTDIAAAHQAVEDRVVGKVLLDVADPQSAVAAGS